MDNQEQDKLQWLREQKQDLLTQQTKMIQAKRLLKNKDFQSLVIKQLDLEIDALVNKLSSPSDISYSGESKLTGIEAVRYLQGQIRTTRGLRNYLGNIILTAEEADKQIQDIDAEIETILGQPDADNQ